MDDHCSSDGYGNTGCIGTAVSTHSTAGGLPMTGMDLAGMLLLGLAVVIAGVIARFGLPAR